MAPSDKPLRLLMAFFRPRGAARFRHSRQKIFALAVAGPGATGRRAEGHSTPRHTLEIQRFCVRGGDPDGRSPPDPVRHCRGL